MGTLKSISCIKNSLGMKTVVLVLVCISLLVGEVIGECGFAGDCNAGDGDYACPGDCQLFVKCSNGIPNIMSCSSGTFFDESLDQCVWNCPWSETTTTPTTTTTSTKPPPTTTTTQPTTTPLTENCFVEKCPGGTDGPEFYRNYSGSCKDYFRCDFGVWCEHSCKWGLIFDNRSTDLVQPGCKLPPLCPNCLDPMHLSQSDIAAARHMENSSVVMDIDLMNTPMCTFMNQETCQGEDIFQPVYDHGPRGGQCTKEFNICYRGWSCFMRCNADLVLDVLTGHCVKKDMLEYNYC